MISTQSVANPARSSRTLAIVASLAFVLTGIVNTFLGPILPMLAGRWHLPDSESGYFFSAQFLGSIVGVSISSLLLPRAGFRASLAAGYLMMACGVAGLLAPNWEVALLGPAVFGLGFGIAIPATNLLISGLNPNRRASSLSIVNFCWGIGAVAAPALLALAERAKRGGIFIPLLSIFLFTTAVSLLLIRVQQPVSIRKQAGSTDREGFSWRLIAIMGAMFFFYVAVEASTGGWIATLAERTPSAGAQGWLLAPFLFWGGLLAGRGIAPLLLRRLRERNLALLSLALACSGMCILVFGSQRYLIIAAGAIAGYGLAAVFPITVALLSHFQHLEQQIAGPMFGLAGLGGAVMPWLVGVISTRSGSLRAGMVAPLLATVLLFGLHFSYTQFTPKAQRS